VEILQLAKLELAVRNRLGTQPWFWRSIVSLRQGDRQLRFLGFIGRDACS
jgi:hypothetical protein